MFVVSSVQAPCSSREVRSPVSRVETELSKSVHAEQQRPTGHLYLLLCTAPAQDCSGRGHAVSRGDPGTAKACSSSLPLGSMAAALGSTSSSQLPTLSTPPKPHLLGLERWLSRSEHRLLLQNPGLSPSTHMAATTVCGSSLGIQCPVLAAVCPRCA